MKNILTVVVFTVGILAGYGCRSLQARKEQEQLLYCLAGNPNCQLNQEEKERVWHDATAAH